MSISPKILLSTKNRFESTLCLLFPKHKTFFSLNTDDCEILNYKKDSKFNVLNWPNNFDWPNDNANEFLSYDISKDTYKEFLSTFIGKYNNVFSEGFLYANLINYDENEFNYSFSQLLLKIFSATKTPTLITYPSNKELTDSLLSAIKKWSTDSYMIINPDNGQLMNIIINYNIKGSAIGSIGSNAIERQRISRKCFRWRSKFDSLPKVEKGNILMNLIEIYLEDN